MRILVSGYYGFGNTGDELILKRIIRLFSNTDHHVTVLDRVQQEQSAEFNIRHVPRWDLRVIYREVKKCHVLISGGGGLLQDVSGPLSPLYYLGIIGLAQRMGKRTLLLGQGFGPLKHIWNRWAAKIVLSKVDFIVPRDQAGMAWCHARGVAPKNLFLGADLVWLLPGLEKTKAKKWMVCLRADWLENKVPDWLELLKQASDQKGRELHFVSLGNRGDAELLDRIRRLPFFRNCGFSKMTGTFQKESEPVRYFRDAQLVFSMRYHGLVLGALAGAVVVGFGKDRKIANLMNELGQPVANEKEIDLKMLLEQLPGLSRILHRRVAVLRERARTSVQTAFDRCGL
ncbi:polysaccharide pyruvyl transferase CsaB [bacterium]|nr:polysaccharide pyruvyl transferase CsaB [bacterium]